jgi:1-acyl-sn-glycerol-3-phosphate acyltransferase
VVRIFFRSVEVAGAADVPTSGPLVVVANHVNGLLDPALLLGTLPLAPRFLGKSTLWQIAPLRPLLAWAGVIPIHRRQDSGADVSQNAAAFARCHEHLGDGGSIALFPEGISHSRPALAPLKTGAARIVLEASRGGLRDLRVLPVGLVWDAKGRFRSRALVNIGPPLDPAPEVAAFLAAEDDAAAAAVVRRLTLRIDDALRRQTLNYQSWEQAAFLARAADLFRRPSLDLPRLAGLAEGFELNQAFIAGHQRLALAHPAEVAAVARAVERYERLLGYFALRDEQVAAAYPPSRVAGWVLRTLVLLLVQAPLAAAGTVVNYLPYRLVGLLAARFGRDADQQATWKLLPALVFYPLTWLALAIVVGLRAGWAWAAVAGLLAAVGGWVAVAFHERRIRLWREARAWLLLRRGRLKDELRERRRAIAQSIADLVERLPPS